MLFHLWKTNSVGLLVEDYKKTVLHCKWMGLGVSLQVWQANIDGGGVISKMAHVGHKTRPPPPPPVLISLILCTCPKCAATKMPSLTIWLCAHDTFSKYSFHGYKVIWNFISEEHFRTGASAALYQKLCL